MTSIRDLQRPLRAWRTFRELARAARSLAAVRTQRWQIHADDAERHLAQCTALAERWPDEHRAPARRILIAIGTDLGLCGALNRQVAAACRPRLGLAWDRVIVVGSRLYAALEHERAECVAMPATLATVTRAATRLYDEETSVWLCFAHAVDRDGRVSVAWSDPVVPSPGASPPSVHPAAQLSPPGPCATTAAALRLRARLAAALCRAVACEAEARWRTMSRAHDACERHIDRTTMALRKLEQEVVTQQMLEARRGGRRRAPSTG